MRRIEKVLSPLGRRLITQKSGGSPIQVGGVTYQNCDAKESVDEVLTIHTQSASAQLKSAALLAALSDPREVEVQEERQSRDHSERMLNALWELDSRSAVPAESPLIPAFRFVSPGDFSSASFWIAISALSPLGAPAIQMNGVNLNPTRMGLAHIIKRMGLSLKIKVEEVRLGEPVGMLEISPRLENQRLQAITLSRQEVVDALDELPIIALLASFAEGESVIRGAAELRVKESDRIEAMTTGLKLLGVNIRSLEDGWQIVGNPDLWVSQRHTVESFSDHRIAMCFLIAQLRLQGKGSINVKGSECLAVSYPEFTADFDAYRETLSLR